MLHRNPPPHELFTPWLLLAAVLHAALILGLRTELLQRPSAHPGLPEVSLSVLSPSSPASEPAKQTGYRDGMIAPLPAASERTEETGVAVTGDVVARNSWHHSSRAKTDSGASSAETGVSAPRTSGEQPTPRANVARGGPEPGEPATSAAEASMGIRSASVMDGRTSQPAAAASPAWSDNAPDAATSGADSSRVGRRPAAAGVASAADAAPARLTAAALGQQISEWSAEYTKGLPAEEAEPPRTAKIEKLATRRLAAAAYERAWQDKVERVGNMNYPEDARRRNLTGGLMLSVGVNADGTIHSMRLRQSSGHEELDQAAMRIVRLAAPFAAFPFELRKDYDVLWITRTWRFLNDNHLATTP